jgi:YVTN family beta-propeller protein
MNTHAFVAAIFLALLDWAAAAPTIPTGQPQDQTAVAGTTVTLMVEALGTPPLLYQWRLYTNTSQFRALVGETNTMLVLTNTQPSSFRYGIVVSNEEGAVTSRLARVTVLVPPGIGSQPTDRSIETGSRATNQVIALGTNPLFYQWRRNNADLPGKTQSSIVFSNATAADSGNYTVVVTNAYGGITSQVARVDVFGPGANINFEGKQTAPVRLSPDGTRLFAVNTPDARLSVFDVSNPSNPILIAEIPVGLEPVSVNPVSNEEAWVVNEVSDSVSVVSVSRGIVTDTVQAKDEPADVVFAAGRAFVSCSRNNLIRVFDLVTHAEVAALPVFGNNPRALAVSPDGTKVYAAFALSGNRTTLIPPDRAPPQPAPINITNAPPQVGLIVDAADPNWSPVIQYTMPDNDVVELSASSLTIARYFSGIGTVNLGLAVNPLNGDLFVANTEARNLVHFEPGVRGHTVDNRLTRIAVADATVTAFDLNAGIDYGTLPNPTARATALAQPTSLVFDPSGSFLYVAAFGSDRIARVGIDGQVLSRLEVGPSSGAAANSRAKRGPRGLALNAAAQRLYVLNRIANTLSVIDAAADHVLNEIPVGSHDPTPAFIRQGRGFLYDAKLSGNGTMSCASCHVDAEMDMLAWDLGNPFGTMELVTAGGLNGVSIPTNRHPMKGPMTTQTLRGLRGLDPLHWRGDRTNFLHFNIGFPGLLGGSLLSDSDMAAYRDFINSIVFQPNPNQNLDRTLPAALGGASPIAGSNSFVNFIYDPLPSPAISCLTCHAPTPFQLPAGSGTGLRIIQDARLRDSQHFKTPHLRNLYQKIGFTNTPGAASLTGFGFRHDGRDSTLFDQFAATRFQLLTNDSVVKSNLAALLLCFDTGTPPAVGYTRTITASNVNTTSVVNDWALLESQASLRFQDAFILAGSVTNISLIGKGTLDGQRCSLLFRPATTDYVTDRSGLGPFTHDELIAKIMAGDILTVMGVPFVSGMRMALDRDGVGDLDGDVLPPPLRIALENGSIRISWTNASGVVLEVSETLSTGPWRTDTGIRDTVGSETSVTHLLPANNRFYRLRGL